VQRLQLVAKRNTRLVRFETGGTNTPVFQPVGFSQSKAKLDALLNSAVSAAFTLHDLRRTAASGMASLGVQPHVIEACLNHKSGAIRGVVAIYNRFNYASEKDTRSTHGRSTSKAFKQHVESIQSGLESFSAAA
jgi:integrase